MDFSSQISALVEKSLKAAAPAGQTVCWQLRPIAGPPPCGRAQRESGIVIVFWLVIAGTWCLSVQGMTLSSALPTQAEVDVVVSAASADLAAQMAKWKP